MPPVKQDTTRFSKSRADQEQRNCERTRVSHSLPLSEREREIAILLTTGASNKEIARQLAISPKTVKNVLTKVFVKTSTRSRTELAVQLVRSGFDGVPDNA